MFRMGGDVENKASWTGVRGSNQGTGEWNRHCSTEIKMDFKINQVIQQID